MKPECHIELTDEALEPTADKSRDVLAFMWRKLEFV